MDTNFMTKKNRGQHLLGVHRLEGVSGFNIDALEAFQKLPVKETPSLDEIFLSKARKDVQAIISPTVPAFDRRVKDWAAKLREQYEQGATERGVAVEVLLQEDGALDL